VDGLTFRFRFPLELSVAEDLWLDAKVNFDSEWDGDLALEGPARGVAVALERVWDLVTVLVEDKTAELSREAAEARDIADFPDFLGTRLVATTRHIYN